MNPENELKSLEVEFSPSLELRKSNLGGIGVFTKKRINAGEILFSVPKESVLSPKTCAAAQFFDAFEEEYMSFYLPQEFLMVAYLFEKMQGEESPWYHFIQIIERAQVPDVYMLWTSEEQALLDGTNLETWEYFPELTALGESYQNLMPLFEQLCVVPTFSVPSFDEFVKAALIVSSRAFDVDNYHDLALVPGACFFNHSDHENVHFETVGEVCSLCGEVECECEVSSDEDEYDEEIDEDELDDIEMDGTVDGDNLDMLDDLEDDDDSDIAENTDMLTAGDKKSKGNNKKGEKSVPDESEDLDDLDDRMSVYDEKNEDEDDEDDEDEDDEDEEDPYEKFCTIRAIKSIKADAEVFNTYGEDPNGVLIPKYGFSIWNNKYDVVNLGPQIEQLAIKFGMEDKFYEWRDVKEEIATNGYIDTDEESIPDEDEKRNSKKGSSASHNKSNDKDNEDEDEDVEDVEDESEDENEDDEDEDEDDDEVFLGLLNVEKGRPRVSKHLTELTECFELDVEELVTMAAKARLENYYFEEPSDELCLLAEQEKNKRKATALYAVSTEKSILERYLNFK